MLTDRSSSFSDNLLVVLVLYEKTLTESSSFASLSKIGTMSFFVYDNSPEPDRTINNSPNLVYIHDPLNRGVSRAYNLGAQVAKKNNKKWILLTDQDTSFPPDWDAVMQGSTNLNPEIGVFAPKLYDQGKLISPFKLILGKGKRLYDLQPEKYSFDDYCIINSGMVISTSLFDRAEGYDERFPLDYSDISFICRLKKMNCYFVLIACVCKHEFDNNNITTSSSRKKRFKIFCEAVSLYQEEGYSFVLRPWVILPRAFKLSYLYQDSDFLKIGIKSILNG